MTSHPSGESLQASALRACTTLLQLRSDWGGAFVLSLGLSSAGTALPIASNIAGAVSLSIDRNPDHIRDVVRSGAVDFVVHSLDEAIRAMKNEVRKRSPLSVALNASPIETLDEILARGLAPQLFSSFLAPEAKIMSAAEQFHSLGAELVDFVHDSANPPHTGFRQEASILKPLLASRSWTMRTFFFQSAAQLRRFDTVALTVLPPEDRLRRRWIEAASRVLQRERPPQRCLWLSPQEEEKLSAELSSIGC
jgi:urocanate hydratase